MQAEILNYRRSFSKKNKKIPRSYWRRNEGDSRYWRTSIGTINE
nr:MAG TPA: hypothetical protein [Caudoviricetes sp.]